MPVKRLKAFLDSHSIRYVTIQHSPAHTAQEIAASAHIPGRELAKTVMVKLDGEMAMAVLPASFQIDFDLLKEATGAKTTDLATEAEFSGLFPGCETGAMPPFGNLYGVRVFVAERLTRDEEIAFCAGSHSELIKMRYDDFERLTRPTVIPLAARVLV